MKLRLPHIILVLLTLAGPAMAEGFDLSNQGLENRVEFWKKVYTQYGENDVIVHDRFHVNLIYDVTTDSDVSSKVAAVELALNEIRSKLNSWDELSPMAKQIREAITANGLSISDTLLTDLRENVHTQRGIKERFRSGIIRSGKYVDTFTDIFKNQGVPAEVALLPLVESSFENRSLSKVGAAGIWQFTRGTGRIYMKVNKKLDERLDPAKATRAAAKLLSDNYKALGSWPLAITAYNHGRGGMMRAQSQVGSDMPSIIKEYRGPLFGYASMNFYSEFLAAVDVYQNYQQYFGQLALDTPSMKESNAPTVAGRPSPKARVQTAKASPKDKYKVRKGDTLHEIATRFGTNISDLMNKNNLRGSLIHAGQILLVK